MTWAKVLRIASVFGILLQPGQASAQETPLPQPGDRIRITAPECQLRKEVAVLESMDEGVLQAKVNERSVQCPLPALQKLEVAAGRRQAGPAAVKGMAILGLTGALAVGASTASCHGDYCSFWYGAFIGGVTGAAAGLVFGALSGLAYDWREASIPGLHPYLAFPSSGRVGLGITVSGRW